jgi:tight adherence protein B
VTDLVAILLLVLTMKIDLLMAILSFPLAGGIAATWLWGRRRERSSVSIRLQKFMPRVNTEGPRTILKSAEWNDARAFLQAFDGILGLAWLRTVLMEAAMEDQMATVLASVFLLLILPDVLAYLFGLNLFIATGLGPFLACVPLFVIKQKADALRSKFCEQLPDAIDLMVAVLRSGHSVSQAVKAVSLEVAKPCGEEFGAVLQRMNLGQPLSDALVIAARRFQSYELDLLRRAVAIQSEVGGSLAELLDKTNSTLRQRLKLVRQLRVVTAQSRLSAHIVGFLPIVLAVGLNFISPGYIGLLTGDKLGQTLLVVVVILEIVGIFVMRRMSTLKV